MTASFAAVDLGASSGRVVVGQVGPDQLALTEVHRFPNVPVTRPDGLYWNIEGLFRESLVGLAKAVSAADDLVSVGVDSWAVDYSLVDATGRLLAPVHHYRDSRSDGAAAKVHAVVSEESLYATTGLQFLPFLTIYQLATVVGTPELVAAESLLLVPDLLSLWLTGVRGAEATNASTTGLFDVGTGEWATDVIDALGIPVGLFPPIRQPGQISGPFLETVRGSTGLSSRAVLTAVGSHDTASAVVGVPARDERFAYISCGTWSLVGVELEHPVLTEESRRANFTNEGGVDGRIRYLRNVMGLWLLSESVRTWSEQGESADLEQLVAAAGALPMGGPVIDVNNPDFLPPGNMPARIRAACVRSGVETPRDRIALVRCILDSLADAYARTLRDAVRLSGREVDVVHLVGGGARNALLCQLTADACELPVEAGPVEATAIGNLLVQARAHGAVSGDLAALRTLIRSTYPVRRFEPGAGN